MEVPNNPTANTSETSPAIRYVAEGDEAWKALSPSERKSALDNSEPILGGTYDSAEDVGQLLDEHGSIRIWQTDPSVQGFLKNLPKDVEKFELREFLSQGGYQGNRNDPGTIILRKKSLGAPVS